MDFVYQDFLPRATYAKINALKTFEPEILLAEAARRPAGRFRQRQVVFAAADHNARMIHEYAGDPLGLCNRHAYLARLWRMLQSEAVDGVEATPDIIEDLLLLNYLWRQEYGCDPLAGKLIVGTVNRGGLKNSVWEMDDLPACFTVERIVKLRLDAVKFMIRINPDDERSKYTLQYCAEVVNQAERHNLPVFIEALYVRSTEQGFQLQTDLQSLCKSVGVVAALGCTSAQKWLEVPLHPDYRVACDATTCAVIVVSDELEQEPLAVVREYTKECGAAENVRGILLGRNVMFHAQDPLPLAEAISNIWHQGLAVEPAYQQALAKYAQG